MMEKNKSFLEVVEREKLLMALIYSNGILHTDFQQLYHKTRTGYKNIILNNNQLVELQEIEYHLWKLHYKLIDEFRKRIRLQSSKLDKHLEGFKSFLSEATEFYGDLIAKLGECQYICHRLLICRGDLARYDEIIKRNKAFDWSTAATYYLEALRTWPDSGNPHNQLALLATYVGDAFLALYHCVRSLAVKEPFPDAWSNLMLVFEENRSIRFESCSNEIQFDFLSPSKRSSLAKTWAPNNDKLEDIHNDLWPILVRTISFLLTRSSSEEFSCNFASALHKLEALFSMDDTKLSKTLECYQYIDSSRKGPYRAIQLASVLIFLAHSLTSNTEKEEYSSTPIAFAAIFICMGRIIERCTTGNKKDKCPLLPAVLIFVEWLVEALGTIEALEADERVTVSMSYFTRSLVDLIDRVDQCRKGISPVYIALWEDHELRGFYPLTRVHEKLDFTTHLEFKDDYERGNEYRCQRIFHAVERIVDRFKSDQESISSGPKTESTAEEEEVILFEPITRRNSAPIYISKGTNDSISSDELLRWTTSLSIDQNSTRPPHPSLSAWVFDQENQETKKQKGHSKDFNKNKLSPIEEIASTSFPHLLINDKKDSDQLITGHISTIIHKSPPYVTPTPSAPVLPNDCDWLRENEANGILGVAPVNSYTNRSPINFVDTYPPVLGMSSSEWLYNYRNSQNLANASNNNQIHFSPIHLNHTNGPVYGNFQSNEASGFDLFDQWGNRFVTNPMVYIEGPQMYANSRDKLYFGYQRTFPYVCGVGMEMSSEQPQLLQYLKEKEWQLQPGSQFRGPSPTTFRGI